MKWNIKGLNRKYFQQLKWSWNFLLSGWARNFNKLTTCYTKKYTKKENPGQLAQGNISKAWWNACSLYSLDSMFWLTSFKAAIHLQLFSEVIFTKLSLKNLIKINYILTCMRMFCLKHTTLQTRLKHVREKCAKRK